MKWFLEILLILASSQAGFESSIYFGSIDPLQLGQIYTDIIYSFIIFLVWKTVVLTQLNVNILNCYMFRSLRPECLQIRKIAWWHSPKFLPNFLYETIIFQQLQSSVTSLSLSDKSPSKSSWKLRYHVTVHKSHSLNKCLLITLYTMCWVRVWRGIYTSCFNASLVQSSCFAQFIAYTIAPLTL